MADEFSETMCEVDHAGAQDAGDHAGAQDMLLTLDGADFDAALLAHLGASLPRLSHQKKVLVYDLVEAFLVNSGPD